MLQGDFRFYLWSALACSAVENNVLRKPEVHKVTKNLGTPKKYGRPYGDMKQVHFGVRQILDATV